MVTEKAMELGQALVDSAEYKAYQEAKTAFENDTEAVQLLTAYTEKEKEITNKISTVSIDPEQFRVLTEELEALRVKATENPLISELTKAQIGFDGVMRMVNDIITSYINPNAQQSGGGCSGN
ncbi:MAG: YlbF family regulator, partial [Christensenellales bacterium]